MNPGPTILLAGCGRWGRKVLRDLIGFRCRVIVCDSAPEARRAALMLGAAASIEHIDDAFQVDGAIVATPTLAHEVAVRALLKRRVPVFCEKPLTTDAASASDLARIGADVLFVMDKWRYHPAVEFLGALARSGSAGRIQRLSTSRLQPTIDGYDVDAVWVLAPHEISIGREIFGRMPPPLFASGELRSGGQARLEAHFRDEVDWRFRISSVAPRLTRAIEAAFDAAICSWSIDDEFTVQVQRGTAEERVLLEPAAPLEREIGAFVDFLGGGPAPKSSARDGAETVAIVERLRRMAGI